MWTELVTGDNPYTKNIELYTTTGDTTFGNKSYKIFKAQYLLSLYTEYRYLYDDTSNKKVYSFNTYTQQDDLLYDFSKNVGDTFNINLCSNIYAIVVDKVLETFAGKNRVKMTISYGDGFQEETWYEGIGNVYGVFRPFTICVVGASLNLLCYFENDTLLYHNSSLNDSCFLVTNIKELSPEKLFNSYFYNHILYIKPAKSISYTLAVYNLFGMKVKEINAAGDIKLNLSYLPNGLYVYRIETNSIHFCQKFILNR